MWLRFITIMVIATSVPGMENGKPFARASTSQNVNAMLLKSLDVQDGLPSYVSLSLCSLHN
jgi:hypothetical protein